MRLGVDWLGFPLRLNVNDPDLTEDEAASVIQVVRPPHRAALITYQNQAADIAALVDKMHVPVAQLHGEISPAELAKLRASHPDLIVVKSIIIRSEASFETYEAMVDVLSPYVDAFITDTFDPTTGASGATGKTHDWSISRQLVLQAPRPVILAGGLTPANVRQAIEVVRPAGVDTHTGVEDTHGRKSEERVKAFVVEAKDALSAL